MFYVKHVFERLLMEREENEFVTSLFPTLPSLKSLVSDFNKWITSFNNDVNLSTS